MVHTRPAIYRGETKKKSHKATRESLLKDLDNPRQEYWPGLPPPRHRSEDVTMDNPTVRNFLASGKRYPKFAFMPNGDRVFMYFTK